MTKKQKINYAQFIIISIIAFVIYLSNQMVTTTISKYANSMQATSQLIGLIGGTFGVMALITRPISGQVVDKNDHKILMFICVGFLVVSNVVLILAKNPIYLLLSRGIYGLSWGFGSTLCMTTACNSLPKEKLSSGISIYTLAQTFAQVLGPSIAIYVLNRASFNILYYITTVLMMVAFLLVFFFRTNHKPNRQIRYSINFKEMFAVNAIIPSALSMCNSMENSAVTAFILLYAESIGVAGVGIFFTIQAVSILAVRPLISKIINEKNIHKIVVVCEFLIVFGLISLFFANSLPYFIVAAILFGFGKGGADPALMSLSVGSVPQHQRGRASNTNYSGKDIGQFIGANLAGFIVGLFGYRYVYLFIILPILIGLAVFSYRYILNPKK